jgi:hypothetical protein
MKGKAAACSGKLAGISGQNSGQNSGFFLLKKINIKMSGWRFLSIAD